METTYLKKEYFYEKENVRVGYLMISEFLASITKETHQFINKFVIILDEFVADLKLSFGSYFSHHNHLEDLLSSILEKQLQEIYENSCNNSIVFTFRVPNNGISIKSRKNKDDLEDFLLESYCHRDTLLIAVGGGGITDLVGYVASTYYRGIPWIAIPTTFLAMVDASIGGKTGIDLIQYGKNLIGSFHQPMKVLIDLSFCHYLTNSLWLQGWAEIIKLTLVFSKDRFEKLENILNKQNWTDHWHNFVREMENHDHHAKWPEQYIDFVDWIVWSVQTKIDIVTKDEKESRYNGYRCLLNFGHTIGHALENASFKKAVSNNKGNNNESPLSHGDAVAFGMIKEVEISRSMRKISSGDSFRIIKCIEAFGWSFSKYFQKNDLDLDSVFDFLKRDKKSYGTEINIIILNTIGSVSSPFIFPVPVNILKMALVGTYLIHPYRLDDNIEQMASYHTINVPGSKSITNRALIMAALANGQSITLHNILHSDDTFLMMEAFRKLNICTYKWSNYSASLEIQTRKRFYESLDGDDEDTIIDVVNAGTVARFIIPVCIFLFKNTSKKRVLLRGCQRMSKRPFTQIIDTFRSLGDCVELINTEVNDTEDGMQDRIFLEIKCGLLESVESLTISPTGSSQFISSLLMVLPILPPRTKLTILDVKSLEEVPSFPFIEMTLSMMTAFGIPDVSIKTSSEGLVFFIDRSESQPYRLRDSYTIEADLTSSSYPIAYAALSGKSIHIPFVPSNSIQGDILFVYTLSKYLGCSFHFSDSGLNFNGPTSLCDDHSSKGTLVLDFRNIGDTFMTMAVISIFCGKLGYEEIIITGLTSQDKKESERVQMTCTYLKSCHIPCSLANDKDSLIIRPIYSLPQNNGESKIMNIREEDSVVEINPMNDHRLAMSFSLFGAILNVVKISNVECVNKTWPDFWTEMMRGFQWNIEPM